MAQQMRVRDQDIIVKKVVKALEEKGLQDLEDKFINVRLISEYYSPDPHCYLRPKNKADMICGFFMDRAFRALECRKRSEIGSNRFSLIFRSHRKYFFLVEKIFQKKS